jgi:hypothetical protein
VGRVGECIVRILVAAGLAVVTFVAGLVVGIAVDADDVTLPPPCAEALVAADKVAAAVEAQWSTASAAVDAAQRALSESGYRERAAACRSALDAAD